jgi:PAS domain S-box-containing protein
MSGLGAEASAEPLEVPPQSSPLSEELALRLLGGMTDGVSIVRTTDAVITYANPRLEQIYGYGPGEFERLPITVLYCAASGRSADQVAEGLLAQLRRAGAATSELPGLRKDGTPLWIRSRASAHSDSRQGQVWLILHEDITVRKLAEDRLRHQERLLGTLIAVLPVGIWLTDAQGAITSVNPAGQRLWQGARDGGPGRSGPYKAWRADTGKLLEPHEWAVERAVRHGETVSGEYLRIQCFDGSYKTILSSATPLYDDGRLTCAIAVTEDVTHLKEAESRFTGIVSTASDAIICVDEAHCITFFNEGAESLFGYTKDELLGAPLDILLPECFRASHQEHVKSFAEAGTPARMMGARMPIRALRKGGEEFSCEASISHLQSGGQRVFTVVLRDITMRKKREDEQRFLAEAGGILGSSLDYEATLKSVSQLAIRSLADYCVIDVVDASGKPRCLSAAAKSEANQGLAEALRTVLDPTRAHLSQEALTKGQATLHPEVTEEFLRSRCEDKEQLKILRLLGASSLMVVPLVARGKTLAALTLLSTKPGRRYAPADLRLAEELAWRAALAVDNTLLFQQAQQATRARDDVLGIVAHDLRNPLNAIKLLAHDLTEHPQDTAGGEEEDSSAELILRCADRMNRLIQDLLEVSRIDSGTLTVELTPVAPEPLLRECLAQVAPLATGHQLHLLPLERLPVLRGSHDRLLQVLLNLLSNALKFTPLGGTISIGAEAQGDHVRFCVRDTGPGIPHEDLPRIFDRHWQGDKQDLRGAGLGLAICKGLVEAHGGRLWAESRLGEGSSFFFTIPTLLALAKAS